MDNTMNNYYYGQQQQTMGQPYYYGGYDPSMNAYPAMGYNAIPAPSNQNALSAEEIQTLKNTRPSNKIDINVSREDVLGAMCTHKENGRDVVMEVNDGTGDVFCPICGHRWKPIQKSKEEVQELIDQILDQMEISKWLGDLPIDMTRDLYPMIPLLKKYPEIHEFAMNNFNKYFNNRNTYNAQDTNVYSMYNSMFTGAGMPATGYNAAPAMGYYGQYQQPVNAGYYQQAPQGYTPNGVQANAMVNPMQAPTYGVNPMAPNQQFVSQANTMMNGTVAQQPYPNQMMNAPIYGAPQQAPVQQPVQPQQNAAAPVTTPQADGTVTSEKKIDL